VLVLGLFSVLVLVWFVVWELYSGREHLLGTARLCGFL